jgi:pimeloyl-ACP methyl ester carboxylesterase
MSAIILEGGILHYEVIGRGRPIIFLHGWVGSWRYWVPAMQTASTNFRAYALDFWGFGDSARDVSRYTIDQQVTLIDRFMNELGIGKIAIVGHGIGAIVGLHFAMRSPSSVDRIMAVDLPLDFNAINTRLRAGVIPDLTDWMLAKTPASDPARADAVKADPLAVTTSFSNPEHYNITSRLAQFRTPTLLVYGQNDPAITVPNPDALGLSSMTHAIVLEQSGHFPMLDETPAFNRLLTDFLALESGETPSDLQLKEEWKRRIR